jgi:hypothetical protein
MLLRFPAQNPKLKQATDVRDKSPVPIQSRFSISKIVDGTNDIDKVNIPKEIQTQFNLVARSRGATSSRLAAAIVADFLRQGSTADQPSRQIGWVSLSPDERNEAEAKTE